MSMIRGLFFVVCVFMAACQFSQQPYRKVFEGAPRINPPYVVGNYPATEFIFAVPTAGVRPMSWTADGLPAGLSLDPNTGIIRGTAPEAGEYEVKITAKNAEGKQTQTLTLKIGEELALTPVMGWNSWNTFGPKLTEALVIETADAMAANGMRDLGYQYINIDDFWQLADRDANGHMVIDSTKFPRGIEYVADYVHNLGFKLGIYSDASRYTCGGVCGSYGYEEIDAQDFASWGVDLLKYDYCGAPDSKDTAIVRYRKMGEALRSTDRSIVYSICEWGQREPWTWAKSVGGHYWRTTWDIRDAWGASHYNAGSNGIIPILDVNKNLADYAGPGAWNDPDMLVVGMFGNSYSINHGDWKFGCTLDQYRTHMSLWCMMASPLLCGNDVRSMPDSVTEILLNPEIIAIDQDVLGKQAKLVMQEENFEVFVKPLSGDRMAVAVLNRGDETGKIQVDMKAVTGLEKGKLRDVWAHEDLKWKEVLELEVAPHVCKVFIVGTNL